MTDADPNAWHCRWGCGATASSMTQIRVHETNCPQRR